LNHVHLLAQHATGLAKYAELGHQTDQAVLITHIFPNSQLARTRTITAGSTINEINGIEIKTLEDFRKAIRKGVTGKYVTIKASDNVARASDNVFVVLPYDKLIQEEAMLSRDYKYQLTDLSKDLVQSAQASATIQKVIA